MINIISQTEALQFVEHLHSGVFAILRKAVQPGSSPFILKQVMLNAHCLCRNCYSASLNSTKSLRDKPTVVELPVGFSKTPKIGLT